MKKLLQAIINKADKRGISKHRAFEEFIEDTFQTITEKKQLTEMDFIYLDTVEQNPFEDVFEYICVEIGYFNKHLDQFMTPASTTATLIFNSQHREALDPSCGTGVNGLVMLAKMFVEHTPIFNGEELPLLVPQFLRNTLTLHLNDVSEMMCKMAFIQNIANYNVHCARMFELDLLITKNNTITEWESDLKVIFKSYVSKQNFTRLCDASKDLIILNPPYSLKDYGYKYAKENTHQERFNDYVPAKSDCLSAFMLSALELMSDTGECFMILPNSVNFTNNCEYVRKLVLNQSMMECNIALPPKLFSETGIPTVAWCLNKIKIFDRIFLIKADDRKDAFDFLKNNTALTVFKGKLNKLVFDTTDAPTISKNDFDFVNLENNFTPTVYDIKQNNKVIDEQKLLALALKQNELKKEE
ncbi:hypothetical protein D6V26_20065 [Vibrio cholerae]|nr:hypothetical protein [Vibrio cholerae]